MEEAGVSGENHRPWATNWETLSIEAASRVHPFFVIVFRRQTNNTVAKRKNYKTTKKKKKEDKDP